MASYDIGLLHIYIHIIGDSRVTHSPCTTTYSREDLQVWCFTLGGFFDFENDQTLGQLMVGFVRTRSFGHAKL